MYRLARQGSHVEHIFRGVSNRLSAQTRSRDLDHVRLFWRGVSSKPCRWPFPSITMSSNHFNIQEDDYKTHRKPYLHPLKSSFYSTSRGVQVVRLHDYKVDYKTTRGGYTGFPFNDRKTWPVDELRDAGCEEIEWNGR